jgi:hypothetical protein
VAVTRKSTACAIRFAAFFICLFVPLGFCAIGAAQQAVSAVASCQDTKDGSATASATPSHNKTSVPPALERDLGLVRQASFPELEKKTVKSRTFNSSSDYFRTRFSVSRFFLLRPMHYFVDMNPRIATSGPPVDSICAILAHELVHVFRMNDGNRLHLLGLVRLVSASYTARFERSADLEAIRRGYGAGLITFRQWVYNNIPVDAVSRKRRNYFSPEEITAILRLTQSNPELFGYWRKHVPLNLQQIEQGSKVNP